VVRIGVKESGFKHSGSRIPQHVLDSAVRADEPTSLAPCEYAYHSSFPSLIILVVSVTAFLVGIAIVSLHSTTHSRDPIVMIRLTDLQFTRRAQGQGAYGHNLEGARERRREE